MDQGIDSGLNDIVVTKLSKLNVLKGDVYHGLKASEDTFNGFGEAYFTEVEKGETKGWKKHFHMTLNLIVPVGDVIFFVHDEQYQSTRAYKIGSSNYVRLTVPPGYWVAFKGCSHGLNLALNIASMEHDPAEAINAPLTKFPLNFLDEDMVY